MRTPDSPMASPVVAGKQRIKSSLISLAQLSSSADLLARSRTQTTKSIGLSRNQLNPLDTRPLARGTLAGPVRGQNLAKVGQRMVKYNSCSTLFLDETIVHADLCQMLKWYILSL